MSGNLKAYGNIAFAQQKGTDIVSNQFLFDPDDIAYIANHYIFTDHSQTMTASAGIYLSAVAGNPLQRGHDLWQRSANRRPRRPNGTHVPGYTQVNVGMSHEFAWGVEKPATVRFDIINLFDTIYEIRDGSGIGVFAPQFGPRREFLVGLSQKF